jgi:hypothetical protein
VINTLMLLQQQAMVEVWPFLTRQPPVLDWLPWFHVRWQP